MALVYFDSSALVKLVVDETGSEIADELWNGSDAAFSSGLAYPEVSAALAAAVRSRYLTPSSMEQAVVLWEEMWAQLRPVELSGQLARSAGELAGKHNLRGADAVHLASALVLSSDDVVFAAWDKRLREGAIAAGLAVAPASIG
jgi:predicted nucleic acid-binding protein